MNMMDVAGGDTADYYYTALGQLDLMARAKNNVFVTTAYDDDALGRQARVTRDGATVAEYSYHGATWMRKTARTYAAGGASAALRKFTGDGQACVREVADGKVKHYFAPRRTPLWEATAAAGE